MLAAALLVSGCEQTDDDGPPPAAEEEAKAPATDPTKPADRNGRRRERDPTRPRRKDNPRRPQPRASAQEPNDRASPRRRGDAAEAPAAAVGDSRFDAEGDGERPAYAELVRASIRRESDGAHLTISLAGEAPAQMPDGYTNLVVGFRMELGGERRARVYAEATNDGWELYTRGRQLVRDPKAFRLAEERIEIVLPWSAVGGRNRFYWHAHLSWTRSEETETYFSFDVAPNDERARFPAR